MDWGCVASILLVSCVLLQPTTAEAVDDVNIVWLIQINPPQLHTSVLEPSVTDPVVSSNENRTGPGLKTTISMVMSAIDRVGHHDFDPFHFARDDVFENSNTTKNFFEFASPDEWGVLACLVVVLMAVDFVVLQTYFSWGFTAHLCTVVFWIAVALGYNAYIWVRDGGTEALNWSTGYLLEWILSMDNLFVFHLVFETYKTPAAQTHKAVFVGIIGAIIIRMLFFMVVATLLKYFDWVRYPFGALLVWSGYQAAVSDEDDEDVQNTFLVRGLRWLLGDRLCDSYKDSAMVSWGEKGQLQFTLLFMVVCCLELTDVVFALDSVSAKVAQIPNTFVAFSSSVLAMFGLRSMFFIVKDLVEMFDLLQYGLCFILVFIGIQLILAHFIHLSSSTVCILIFSVFLVCIVGSVARKKNAERANSNQGQ